MSVPDKFASAYAEQRARYPVANASQRKQNGLLLLNAIASLRGGVLRSSQYEGYKATYSIQCMHGHAWKATGQNIINGCWCPDCAGTTRAQQSQAHFPAELAKLQQIALAHGGACLASTYLGRTQTHRFRCAAGHEWATEAAHIVRGHWCPQCARLEASEARREGLEPLQEKAQARGGQCMSTAYTNVNARYRFRCAEGHEWNTQGSTVLQGAWCPCCEKENRKLGIEAMRALAAERGGQCLSEHYANSDTKLEWVCHKGHHWQATPGSVKHRGHWCPVCARLNRITNSANRAARLRGGAV